MEKGGLVRCFAPTLGITRGMEYLAHDIVDDEWLVLCGDNGCMGRFARERFREVQTSSNSPTRQESSVETSPDEDVSDGHGETILLVDDNPDLRRVTAEQLLGLGYQVLAAGDTRQALTLIDSDQPIDLLFSDIVMPGGMNDFELARAAVVQRPTLKILLMTGFNLSGSSQEAIRRIGRPVLGKPHREAQLASELRKVLGRLDVEPRQAVTADFETDPWAG
jgi:CheY-like chemotaxis protein